MDPGPNEYDGAAKFFGYLRSDAGKKWGAGAICKYRTASDLQDPNLDLAAEFLDAVETFAPLLMSVLIPKNQQMVNPLDQELEEAAAVRPAMGLAETLHSIMDLYPTVRTTSPFGRRDDLWSLFEQFCEIGLSKVPTFTADPNLSATWGGGKGNWAAVPWIAILDRRETTDIQTGRYVVFLFRESMDGVYLTLNQGTTALMNESPRGEARVTLQNRAVASAQQLGFLRDEGFQLAESGVVRNDWIDLKTDANRPKDYEYGAIAG